MITDTGDVWAWGLNQVGQVGSVGDGSGGSGGGGGGGGGGGDEELWPRLLMKNGLNVKCGPNTTAVIVNK